MPYLSLSDPDTNGKRLPCRLDYPINGLSSASIVGSFLTFTRHATNDVGHFEGVRRSMRRIIGVSSRDGLFVLLISAEFETTHRKGI